MSDLVVSVLLAPPAGTEVLDGDAKVGDGVELEQHLLRFVEQVTTETSLHLQHALRTHRTTSSASASQTSTQ